MEKRRWRILPLALSAAMCLSLPSLSWAEEMPAGMQAGENIYGSGTDAEAAEGEEGAAMDTAAGSLESAAEWADDAAAEDTASSEAAAGQSAGNAAAGQSAGESAVAESAGRESTVAEPGGGEDTVGLSDISSGKWEDADSRESGVIMEDDGEDGISIIETYETQTERIQGGVQETEDVLFEEEEAETETDTLSLNNTSYFTVGDFTYGVDKGVAYISGYNGTAADVTLPARVEYGGQTYRLKRVGSHAFSGNAYLENLVIPENYTNLDGAAFSDCASLSSITINGNIGNCSGFSTFSYGTWSRDYSVFYHTGVNTDGITVTFGPAVTEVPEYLFATGLEKTDDVYAHVTKVVFSDGVKVIGRNAFYRCYDLKEVVLSSTIEEIGISAFDTCTSLTEISWQDAVNLKTIGEYAFSGDSSLVSVSLPDRLNTVSRQAFNACTGLQTLIVPQSVSTLGMGAFRNCTNLSSVTINGNVGNCSVLSANPNSDFSADYSVFYNTGTNALEMTVTFGQAVTAVPEYLFATGKEKTEDVYAHVTKVVFPKGVKVICRNAFYRCYDLKEVVLSSTIEEIGISAFDTCISLTEISWQDAVNLKTIGEYAFSNDSSLASVSLPGRVNTIGRLAFNACTGLKKAVLPKSVSSLGWAAFKSCVNLTSLTINGNIGDCDGLCANPNGTFSKERSVFYQAGIYGDGVTVTFGPSVTRIPAFLFATSTESENIFANVTQAVIPAGVKEIGDYAFFNCCHLKTIIYGGTAASWEKLGGKTGNDILFSIQPVYAAPQITVQPKDAFSMAYGKPAIVSVKAEGASLKYSWQYRKAGEKTWTVFQTGNGKPSLSVQMKDSSFQKMNVRCVLTGSYGFSTVTRSAVLTVAPAPQITGQPRNGTSLAYKEALKVSVTASGTGLTYSWQYQTAKGNIWRTFPSGNGKSSYTVSMANGAYEGIKVRCVVKDRWGRQAVSRTAVMKFELAPKITLQPKSQSCSGYGKIIRVSVKASGTGLTYSWQYQSAGKTGWITYASSSNGRTYLLVTMKNRTYEGIKVRCVVRDRRGRRAVSRTAVLRFASQAPTITVQPKSQNCSGYGKTIRVSLKATGTGLTYSWQYQFAGKTGWNTYASSRNGRTYVLVTMRNRTYRGIRVRCIVKDKKGRKVTSRTATLGFS